MSVRQSLLAILDQGPCYGYQLRAEFDRRTGSTWPLNVGQIYNTLERLERDGLVSRGDSDEHGHVYWRITDAGSAEAGAWLGRAVARQPGTRDELPIKLALAATLPAVDAAAAVRAQRAASRQRLEELRAAAPDGAGSPEELAAAIVSDALILAAEAELRWLELVGQRLATGAPRELPISSALPRRGRPPRAA